MKRILISLVVIALGLLQGCYTQIAFDNSDASALEMPPIPEPAPPLPPPVFCPLPAPGVPAPAPQAQPQPVRTSGYERTNPGTSSSPAKESPQRTAPTGRPSR